MPECRKISETGDTTVSEDIGRGIGSVIGEKINQYNNLIKFALYAQIAGGVLIAVYYIYMLAKERR